MAPLTRPSTDLVQGHVQLGAVRRMLSLATGLGRTPLSRAAVIVCGPAELCVNRGYERELR